MTFNINEFRSTVNRMGIAKTNLFEVSITAPPALKDSGFQTDYLRYMCNSAELPALDVVTYDVKPYGIGSTEKKPSGIDFNTVNTIFYVDEHFRSMNFFHAWISKMVDFNTHHGSHQVYYKSGYATTIDIQVYSANDTKYIRHYTLYNAYPINVGSVTTAWQNQNEVMTLPVGFTYDGINIQTTTR